MNFLNTIGKGAKRFFGKEIPKEIPKRSYAGANMGRLLTGWLRPSTSADAELETVLAVLRDRSRELSRNNDYARKFMKMCITNVIGPSGIILQNKAKVNGNGKLDTDANKIIEEQWAKWGKRGNCTVDGRMSWWEFQKLFIESVARDGEAIIRKVKGWNNKWNFALQMIEPDHLDEKYSDDKKNIKMGIQFDKYQRPINYFLYKRHPGEKTTVVSTPDYETVPASDIIHAFRIERAGQSRGVPWMHSAMTRLYHCGQYEEAELVAARIGAAKMGFYKPPEGSALEIIPDKKDSSGNLLKKVEPGILEELPPGWDFQQFTPDHPVGNFPNFMKATLRGISAGLNVSYNSLANDLEGVNYSSLRSGALEERDNWRILQAWTIESLCNPVFNEWLYWFLLSGIAPLPLNKLENFNFPTWKPRGWAWVDPSKDSEANRADIMAGLTTRSKVVSERGDELEDIYEQLQHENELSEQYGLDLKLEKATPQLGGQPNANSPQE